MVPAIGKGKHIQHYNVCSRQKSDIVKNLLGLPLAIAPLTHTLVKHWMIFALEKLTLTPYHYFCVQKRWTMVHRSQQKIVVLQEVEKRGKCCEIYVSETTFINFNNFTTTNYGVFVLVRGNLGGYF